MRELIAGDVRRDKAEGRSVGGRCMFGRCDTPARTVRGPNLSIFPHPRVRTTKIEGPGGLGLVGHVVSNALTFFPSITHNDERCLTHVYSVPRFS